MPARRRPTRAADKSRPAQHQPRRRLPARARPSTRTRPRRTGQGPRKGPSTLRTMIDGIDARIARHVPCPIANGPYTIIRSKTVYEIPVDIHTSILGFGSFKSDTVVAGVSQGPPWTVPILGYHTNAAQTRPQVLSWIPDSYLNGAANNSYNLSLHALTIEVRCYRTPTTAGGDFYLGTLRQNFSRTQYATYPSMINSFVGTRQAKHYSCYEAVLAPRVAHSCPMDMVNYSSMDPLGPTPTGVGSATDLTVTMDDSMSPIILIVPAGSSNITVNIYAEWRTINNTDRAIADMAVVHPITSANHWQSVVAAVHEHGGDHASLMQNLQKGTEFMTGAMHLAGVVAPLLAA